MAEQENKSVSGTRFRALDGLRGLAVILVVFNHVNFYFGGLTPHNPFSQLLATVFGWGWIGVDLFFVLSGFLITGILYDAKGKSGFFLNFYARRSLRIFPLYFGYLLVFMFVIPVLHRRFAEMMLVRGPEAASLYLYYFNFYSLITGEASPYVGHFWSLCVEEHFYLVWPILVWAFSRKSLMRLCVVVALGSMLLRGLLLLNGFSLWVIATFTFCRLDGLLVGAFVALALRDRSSDWKSLSRWNKPVFVASACALLAIFLEPVGLLFFFGVSSSDTSVTAVLTITVQNSVLALFFASTMILTVDPAPNSRLTHLLESRVLTIFGKYSYGIYVVHCVILGTIFEIIMYKFFPGLAQAPDYVAKPAMALMVMTASFIVAWFSFHLYEKHFLALKRFFEDSRERRRHNQVDAPTTAVSSPVELNA